MAGRSLYPAKLERGPRSLLESHWRIWRLHRRIPRTRDVCRMNVLLVDDEPNVLKTLSIVLQSMGFTVASCRSPIEALEVVRTRGEFDLAFLDLKMYPMDGIELMERLHEVNPATTISIITAHGTVDTAVEAIKRGAYDYLLKPIELDELRRFVEKAIAFHRLQAENRALRRELMRTLELGADIITRNPDMLTLIALAERVADTPLPVLLEGESGTGKELFASLIHRASSRTAGPFVRVNCAALPESLLESELFGHVRGSFTGAHKDRIGRFELAQGGTVLLDEVGELPLQLQAKLLRVLQNREFERLGESQTRIADVRIVAATNKDLQQEIQAGRFREDLYYRLNGVKLRIPPLRDRPDDIPLLAQFFIIKHQPPGRDELTLSTDALSILAAHPWKGNVRELENVIARAVFLASGDQIGIRDLPDEFQTRQPRQSTQSLEEVEKEHIARIMAESKSLEEAARTLNIDQTTLWRKRKKYNL